MSEPTLMERLKKELGVGAALSLVRLPEYMHDGILSYLFKGRPTGDFLYAVFTNNLMDSFARADEHNSRVMRYYAEFLYGVMPSSPQKAYGSEENVRAWIKIGGLDGLLASMANSNKEEEKEES